LLYMKDSIREFARLRRMGASAYFNTNRTHVFERVYALMTCPSCLILVGLQWHRCYIEKIGNECRANSNDWISLFIKTLLLIQSTFSFLNLFRGMMGFPEYGHFVLMLIQMLQHDMRKFCAIYAIFLFGFSHLLYISQDLSNTGYFAFFTSMRVGFQAALQQVDLNIESKFHLSFWTRQLVLAIVLANFFLVSLVLINLLIAMMSSTYEGINQGAKRQWNLVRARIITNLDKEMSAAERRRDCNNYWENESEGRFMTFTTSENRDKYLNGQLDS